MYFFEIYWRFIKYFHLCGPSFSDETNYRFLSKRCRGSWCWFKKTKLFWEAKVTIYHLLLYCISRWLETNVNCPQCRQEIAIHLFPTGSLASSTLHGHHFTRGQQNISLTSGSTSVVIITPNPDTAIAAAGNSTQNDATTTTSCEQILIRSVMETLTKLGLTDGFEPLRTAITTTTTTWLTAE